MAAPPAETNETIALRTNPSTLDFTLMGLKDRRQYVLIYSSELARIGTILESASMEHVFNEPRKYGDLCWDLSAMAVRFLLPPKSRLDRGY